VTDALKWTDHLAREGACRSELSALSRECED
jgi:hypothetical protein